MKFKFSHSLLLAPLFFTASLNAQSIYSETVDFQLLKQPLENIDAGSRNYKVTVSSPYNLTADDVIKKTKADYQKSLTDYSTVVKDSEKEFQQRTSDYDVDVAHAREKYEAENAEFKKLSLLERLSLTEQKKNPKLIIPSKPVYVKPSQPVYQEPRLSDFTIVDNDVLASQIAISGFTRGKGYVDVIVDVKSANFQDNAGQTFVNQPAKLVVKINGTEKINTSFFQDYTFLSSSPTNNINKPLEEKNHLNMVIKFINEYLNNTFGFQATPTSVKILSVKNKGKFDDLERADINVKTNLRKLQPVNSEINDIAFTNMQKGIDIWTQTLTKVEYKNEKADFNAKIAQFIYFNLIRLNIALNRKSEAEKYLNQLQDNLKG